MAPAAGTPHPGAAAAHPGDDGAATLTWSCKGAAAAGAFTQLSVTLALAGGVERKSAVVEIGDGGKVVVPP